MACSRLSVPAYRFLYIYCSPIWPFLTIDMLLPYNASRNFDLILKSPIHSYDLCICSVYVPLHCSSCTYHRRYRERLCYWAMIRNSLPQANSFLLAWALATIEPFVSFRSSRSHRSWIRKQCNNEWMSLSPMANDW